MFKLVRVCIYSFSRKAYSNKKSKRYCKYWPIYYVPRQPRLTQLGNCAPLDIISSTSEKQQRSRLKNKNTDFSRFVDDVLENGCKLSGRRRCRFRITVKTRRSCFQQNRGNHDWIVFITVWPY